MINTENPLRKTLIRIANQYIQPIIDGEQYTLSPAAKRKVELCYELIKVIDSTDYTNFKKPKNPEFA